MTSRADRKALRKCAHHTKKLGQSQRLKLLCSSQLRFSKISAHQTYGRQLPAAAVPVRRDLT